VIRRSWRSLVLAFPMLMVGAAVVGSGNTSCATAPDNKRFTEIVQPDYASYREFVDPYIQRRCGTLDCHGQPGRAYRIYGYGGFRLYNLDASLVSGQDITREEEIVANYQAAISLEPEEMSRVIAKQGADPNSLLLLRKPLRLERHKGGPSMAEDDPGYRCVVAWLRVRTVRSAPDGLFETIPPEERDTLPESGRRACLEAAGFP
jgi:hypothetical protein